MRLEGDFTCSTHWKSGFICDADHWWHSFCVAGAVFGEVGGWLFVTAAALRDILGDSRSAKYCILQYKIVSKMGRVRSPKRRVPDDDFIVRLSSDIVGLSSNRLSIGGSIQGVSAEIFSFKISWQAQYLERLEGDFTCSTKWRFIICDADHWWHSSCVAGAVFGEVRVGLFVTAAALRDILGDIAGTRNAVFYITKSFPRSDREGPRSGGCEMTISCSDYLRILLESSFYWRKHFREFPLKSWASRFRGRRSIWWGWMVTLLAPRIGNDVSYVTQIIDDIHFAWQAHYLVRLEGDFTCSTHWKWRFICDADHWWHSFCVAGALFGEFPAIVLCSTHWKWRSCICDADHWWYPSYVAGAVFGEVRVGLFVTAAAHRDILGDSRSAKCCILQWNIVSKMGRVRSPKWRVRDDNFMLGLCSDYPRNRLSIGGSTSGSFRWNLELQDLVAGAVFGEVRGWLYLLHALEMTFHMWRRSLMTFILRGRRTIWWGWRVTLLAPRIGNEVSK